MSVVIHKEAHTCVYKRAAPFSRDEKESSELSPCSGCTMILGPICCHNPSYFAVSLSAVQLQILGHYHINRVKLINPPFFTALSNTICQTYRIDMLYCC
ncbi:hypothetical protein FKM82_001827 [Ascaphus truei]